MKSSPKDNLRLVYDSERGDLRKAREGPPRSDNTGASKAGRPQQVRVFLDTKQRRGKAVTVVAGIYHNPQVIAELAAGLKRLCGAGGTVKGKDIEIQGDHRAKVAAKLRELGYDVKT